MSTAPRPAADGPTLEAHFTQALPGDADASNTRRQVFRACYSRVQPTPVAAPRTLAVARPVADLLQVPAAFTASQAFADAMAGNSLLPGSDPHAMCYGGHQFGNWAGQLGDGRAINLGERTGTDGRQWMLQLKGAGETPYSRSADGRAVLRSSVREYLCSEAMAQLGVPTTRALSLVGTGEEILRDMFYDGRAAPEPGAVVCRVAPNFVRFGNFEIFAAREDRDTLKTLLDYVIEKDFPTLTPDREGYVAFFEEVARRTALMIVHWLRVGFVHGVMNTDNMSILGLTIDYGPYGWLEAYDPDWTPNTTDAHGRRYRFGAQPQIGMWNLTCLGNALLPLVDETEPLQAGLQRYADTFNEQWLAMMAAKIGLPAHDPELDQARGAGLVELLQEIETDMTLFFRQLAEVPLGEDASDAALLDPLAEAWYDAAAVRGEYREKLLAWLRDRGARLRAAGEDAEVVRARMNAVNPRYVLRNWIAQLAIDEAAQGDLALLHDVERMLAAPYTEQPEFDRFYARRPDWAKERAGCSMLSCSS